MTNIWQINSLPTGNDGLFVQRTISWNNGNFYNDISRNPEVVRLFVIFFCFVFVQKFDW